MNKTQIIFAIVITLFLITRLLGLGQLYHQDEYRWISIANTAEFGELESPHPPIMEFLLSLGGKLFGYDNLRAVPFFFGILNLLLVYLISLKLTGNKKIAYLASGFYAVSVYGLIANLMMDIDGSIMPFFVLLAYYFYLRIIKDDNKKFLLLFGITILFGLFTKLSYLLFVGAIIAEYLWNIYDQDKFTRQFKTALKLIGVLAVFIIGFYVLYGKYDPRFVEYSSNFKFLNFASRAYFELFMRMFKFFIWWSPLLFLPMFYGLFKKEIFKKYRLWYIYALFNFLFYLVIFDFARLPIERYFMFIIAPSVLIGAEVIHSLFQKISKKKFALCALGFLVLATWTVFIANEVIPLNPKEAYIEKVKDLDFNFLIPLTGGSGPIGFYGSAQFILWAWLISIVALLYCYIVKKPKEIAAAIFVTFGIGYNVLFSVENLTGIAYGSVDKITKASVGYIINNDEVKNIVTYYDAGVYYLKIVDKYNGRFYTAPSRDYSQRLKTHRGHYMVVDFPAIDKGHFYWQLISRCELDKKFTDKYVDSYIFDCRSLPPEQP